MTGIWGGPKRPASEPADVTESVQNPHEVDCQLAKDEQVFKGRRRMGLAAKGFEETVRGTLTSGLAHTCRDWDEALSNVALPPQPEYVTTETFETYKALGGGVVTIVLGALGWIIARIWPISAESAGVRVMLEAHILADEERHQQLVTRLTAEHLENQVKLKDMEVRLMAGQSNMMTEIHRVGDLLNRYILPRERRD